MGAGVHRVESEASFCLERVKRRRKHAFLLKNGAFSTASRNDAAISDTNNPRRPNPAAKPDGLLGEVFLLKILDRGGTEDDPKKETQSRIGLQGEGRFGWREG
jgi:hypothetical protein